MAGAGVATLGWGVLAGGPWTGYGIGPAAVLLRIGVALIALCLLDTLLAPTTLRRASLAAAATVVTVFVAGACVMYVDLGVNPPENGTTLTLPLLVAAQAELALVALPVPAGYVAGTLRGDERNLHAVALLVAATLLGGVGAASIAYSRGATFGFVQVMFFAGALAAAAFALVPLAVMRYTGASARGAETSA
ncbi:hypothetical protein [Halobacterium hubeiense]|uniref:hypothetical protein n=1 Tax=Halobacterium hubeiense TaxID=1407499 RepID=UPI003C7818C5